MPQWMIGPDGEKREIFITSMTIITEDGEVDLTPTCDNTILDFSTEEARQEEPCSVPLQSKFEIEVKLKPSIPLTILAHEMTGRILEG